MTKQEFTELFEVVQQYHEQSRELGEMLHKTLLAQWGDVIANANDIAEMVKQHFVELINKGKEDGNIQG